MKAFVAPVLGMALAIAAPARADEASPAQVVTVPARCAQFWSIPGGASSPVAWDSVISFASCVQDRRVFHVAHEHDLVALVDELRTGLVPSLQLYSAAIEQGPPDVQLRAAYHVGLAQIAFMTRARASLASSDLRESLEALLDPHAELAYYVFTTIHRAAADHPSLTRDVVTQYMARSSREHAASLRSRWSTPPDDGEPRFAYRTDP